MGLCGKEWDPSALECSTGKFLVFNLPWQFCNFFAVLGLMLTMGENHCALNKSLQSMLTVVVIQWTPSQPLHASGPLRWRDEASLRGNTMMYTPKDTGMSLLDIIRNMYMSDSFCGLLDHYCCWGTKPEILDQHLAQVYIYICPGIHKAIICPLQYIILEDT